MSTIQTKKCSKCNKSKPLTEFHKDYKATDKCRSECKTCRKQDTKHYYIKNKQSIIAKNHTPEKLKRRRALSKLRRIKNHKHIVNYERKYHKKNEKHLNIIRNIRNKQRYKSDILYKITISLRNRMWKVLHGTPKTTHTLKLLGCTIKTAKIYIENQFTKGMSWKNYGKWHIDHIRPCSSFDLTDPKQQKECFHYTNLQPLWAKDNILKGNKW